MRTLREANNDLIAPALFNAFEELGLAGKLPDDVRTYLRYLHDRNAACNELIRDQCLEIGRILAAAGTDAVLLKGAAWLFEDGPARRDRMMRDIDMLIAADRIAIARAALAAAGYRVAVTIVAEIGHVHEPPMLRDGAPANVELHVELSTRTAMLPAAEVLARSVRAAPGLRVPAPMDRIVHNVVHAQIVNGDHAGGVASMRDMLDLARLIGAYGDGIDWRAMAETATARGYFRQLSGAMHKAALFAGAGLPEPFAGDAGGRRHARRCAWQRGMPFVDRQLRRLGILRRALAWERDSFALGLGDDRGLAARLKVNRRRLSRIARALKRAAGKA